MLEPLELHITVETAGKTAIDVLSENAPLSKQQLKQAMQKGCVWLTHGQYTQRLRRVKKPLKTADIVHLYYNESILQQPAIPSTLIADEGDYSVWDKAYGVLSHGSKWGDHLSLPRWAETQLQPQRNAFIVHRLDRAATGLIMLAHSKQAATKLSQLFENRDIKKKYQIIVEGKFPEQQQTYKNELDGKQAITHATLKQFDAEQNQSHLDISIETGYKHQIRRHLSLNGFAIVGDRLYGQKSEQNLQLRACELTFISPFDQLEKTYTAGNLK